jgi:prepilin-type N-terminal cleavage/methylation domain-containing protein
MTPQQTRKQRLQAGLSMPELLLVLAVMGILAALSVSSGAEILARQRLEAATRRLDQGLQLARAEAQRLGQACGMSLGATGWQATALTGSLPPCLPERQGLAEGIDEQRVQLSHNLPAQLRLSRNGLVLDGGTVVLSSAGTALQRCWVMALPLGITRLGRYSQGSCVPDSTL